MSRDCPDRHSRYPSQYHDGRDGIPPPSALQSVKPGIVNAVMVEAGDIYPEGGSGDIGMEVNANMVEEFSGWVGKEQVVENDGLVAALDGRSMPLQ